MTEWKWTKDEAPPKGVIVIGRVLDRFVNADWRWSEPYFYFHGREFVCQYQEPTIWMLPAEAPEIPDDPAREKAKAIGERDGLIWKQIEGLKQQLRAR